MAKDGTNRGGRRLGSGRKLSEAHIVDLSGRAADLTAKPLPKIKQYLNEKQSDGKPLGARRIYKDMLDYLQSVSCVEFVPEPLLEQYSICVARWIQAEHAVSEHGMLGRHPTTKGVIASPFIGIAHDYMKQANQALFQIVQIVQENRVVQEEPAEESVNDLLKRLRAKSS